MVSKNCDNPKIDAPVFFIYFFLVTAFILFYNAINIYRIERPKEVNYRASNCLVVARGFVNTTCQSHRSTYVCFRALWQIRRNETALITNTIEGNFLSPLPYRALEHATIYEVKRNYSCWYDERESQRVQWNKPSTKIVYVFAVCGLLCCLIAVLLLVLVIHEYKYNR